MKNKRQSAVSNSGVEEQPSLGMWGNFIAQVTQNLPNNEVTRKMIHFWEKNPLLLKAVLGDACIPWVCSQEVFVHARVQDVSVIHGCSLSMTDILHRVLSGMCDRCVVVTDVSDTHHDWSIDFALTSSVEYAEQLRKRQFATVLIHQNGLSFSVSSRSDMSFTSRTTREFITNLKLAVKRILFDRLPE